MEMSLNNNWVCIDFGTCNTTAAIDIDGKPHVVTYGNTQFFPTIACVLPNKDIQVCQNAEPLRLKLPENFKQEFKLNIAEQIDLNGIQYVDIVREILKYVKGCAQIENNNQECDSAILTIPAIYTENDRRIDVMRRAAIEAGFRQVEFMSEPQAAARHYAYIMGKKNTGLSLIYDLGGGTFDPALLDMSNAREPKLIGNESGVKCGGHFFDAAIYKYLYNECQQSEKSLIKEAKLEDYDSCKRIKEALSIKENASQLFSNGQTLSLGREKFNELIREKIALTLKACDTVIQTAGRSWSDIKQVLFVGGSTAIPLIREMMEKHIISHNASNVKVIRNITGENGSYDNNFATCLGGISSKILPPPPPPEPIAQIIVNGVAHQLKDGINSFGRDVSVDFHFDDPMMSRKHFIIVVTKDAHGKWCYTITTCSTTKATILNNMEPLDLQSYPISRKSVELQDGWTILAGKTTFQFKKANNSSDRKD